MTRSNKTIGSFTGHTVSVFFNDGEVRAEVCRAIARCGGGGGSTLTGGSGIQVKSNKINVGLDLTTFGTTNEGMLTEDTYLVRDTDGSIYLGMGLGTDGKLNVLQLQKNLDADLNKIDIFVGDTTGTFDEENHIATQVGTGSYLTSYYEGADKTGQVITFQGKVALGISNNKVSAGSSFVQGLSFGGRVGTSDTSGITLDDTLEMTGIKYLADYSANFTDRSLVDKAYVDNEAINNHKGGQSVFTANSITTIFDITHNLGAIPSFFSITTTQPIAANHLNRTITFPDSNTMRITFALPPNVGEDANYVWVVYK